MGIPTAPLDLTLIELEGQRQGPLDFEWVESGTLYIHYTKKLRRLNILNFFW